MKANDIATLLDKNFKIQNFRNLTYFLGFEVARNSKGIQLYQRKYTLDLLHETRMLGSASVSIPMDFSKHIPINNRDLLPDSTSYRRLTRKLIYLTNTRPNITYVFHNLNQYVTTPTLCDHQADLCILPYLK